MASDNVNEQRVVIKFYTLLGKSFSDRREDLYTVYGDSCISKSAISKWVNRFKDGRYITKSDKRKGRPVTVSSEKKVAEIQEYILEDRIVTVENDAEHFGISYGTVWKHPSSPSPTKALISKSASKSMTIIFCDIQGIILNHFVSPKTTVTESYYSTVIESELLPARKKAPTS